MDYFADLNDPVKFRKVYKVAYRLPNDGISFMVNEREVGHPLHEYYLLLLGLQDTREMTFETIRIAYRQKIYIAKYNGIDGLVSDLDAARKYLIDHREYMTQYN